MPILQPGVPGISANREAYLAAIQAHGFEPAHRQLLHELKAWVEGEPAYCHQPRRAAEQGWLLHCAFLTLARDAGYSPVRRQVDVLFALVFGAPGRSLLARKDREAHAAVRAYMREHRLWDEREAQRRLSGEMLAGMATVAAHGGEIARATEVLGQVEQAIGPVAWDDAPPEGA